MTPKRPHHGLLLAHAPDGLARLRWVLDPGFTSDPAALDHHERDGYRSTFGAGA